MLKTVREAAAILRVSVSSIYDMCSRNEIEHHRGRGMGIRISDEQIARYLEKTARREPELPRDRNSRSRPRHLQL